MSYYTADKAVGRRAADPLDAVLNPTAPLPGSNQTRFTKPDEKTVSDVSTAVSGKQLQMTPNTKGTGKENVESSIALAGKRKLNVSMSYPGTETPRF